MPFLPEDPEAAAAAGAKLYEVKSGDYYDQYKEHECPILILEYPSSDTEVEITLPSKTAFWQVMPYKYNELITMNGNTIYDTSGMLFDNEITDKVRIRMSEDVALMKDEIEAGSKDSPAGLKVLFHKNMSTMNPMFVIFCRMNPASTTVDWTNAWNQTADLTVQSGCNMFTINSGEWTGATGTWSVY